ncbi:MAG: bifunctional oligoribonuclease/PAP phosphatase NrnA [Actinobacteria bacterium]|nr:bifunctional oligoribonuclease/PAP phosphatase NrnA [Actinomycetota bacterium]
MRHDAAQWDEAVEALRAAPEVAIACHVNPDGDALGSLLAAALGLQKLGKKTYASWSGRSAEPLATFGFLSGVDNLLLPDDLPETETFLALDCGAADRLGDLEPLARKAQTLINVDHHPGNDDFGTINVVIPNASSTAELVADLLRDAGVEFDRDIASCLYTGIVTDTGRFSYANTRPQTLRLAANLLEYDVSAPDIARDVFESAPFGYLKLVGHILERAELVEDARFVYSWLTRADLDETGVSIEETDRLVETIRATRAVDVAALFKEQPDGRWRVSLRSKGPGIAEFARARGGGGHELAAGFTTDDRDEVIEALAEDLRNR